MEVRLFGVMIEEVGNGPQTLPEFPIAPILQPTCWNYVQDHRIGRIDHVLTLCSDYSADML
jgi:hypothetical protein